MKVNNIHTTNYYNAFIAVADDCPIATGEMPPLKGTEKTAANIQFEMVIEHPYQYTSDDVVFQVFAVKQQVGARTYDAERAQFFSKGQPCMRASPLTKRYGWGIHFNEEGKLALYARESAEYKKYIQDERLQQVKAMRSKRV
ncbi:hypothetical protein F0L74_30970 [Chitinophaga agrisoli]|uniref:Uncharacterized protein n=1 Tax=Chitinophaga agrisoli TaxID=2607653 RepID=A0A5B2VP54_9BACT|nr:DUF6157 family protein [Chitinophaga agrisoli]KAA2240574.1 hypothetical protein F0L74_30970 [Chitinophaga agrisoli]